MVTKRKAASAAPSRKLRYEPWRLDAVVRERAGLLAEEIHEAVDAVVASDAKVSFDELEKLEAVIARLKRAPRRAPDLEAVRALSVALDALRAKEARTDVAARCLAALKQADSRFAKLNSQQLFAALAKFAPFAPVASTKGKRT
ncbi:MAG TPA: hypothetical protein VM580_30755, partial [Labilithrix sp.]|nr:hypothetical protein [Labilithrix sp.]